MCNAGESLSAAEARRSLLVPALRHLLQLGRALRGRTRRVIIVELDRVLLSSMPLGVSGS